MKQKILSLLVLLLTAATGAWAQGYEVTFSGFADDNLNTTVQVESLPQSFTQINGYELESSALEVVGDNSDHYALVQVTESCNGMVAVSISPTTITVRGAFEGTAAILFKGVDGNYNSHNRTVYLTCVEKPAVEVNTNAETEGANFTEAWFNMPAFDATAEYELVRDLSESVNFLGIPTGNGATVKKDGDKYTFATAPTITLEDNISGTAQAITAEGITLNVYPMVEMEGKWKADETAPPVALADFLASPQPGRWMIKATATTGLYDGTLYSPEFTLAEAYDLTLSPATDAHLKSVTVAGTAATPTEGVIKGIEPGKKVKITTTGPDYIIRKAAVKKTVKQ